MNNTSMNRIALAWARTTKADSTAARLAKQIATVSNGALVTTPIIDALNTAFDNATAIPRDEARAAISALHESFTSSGSLPLDALQALCDKLPEEESYDALVNALAAARRDAAKPNA